MTTRATLARRLWRHNLAGLEVVEVGAVDGRFGKRGRDDRQRGGVAAATDSATSPVASR